MAKKKTAEVAEPRIPYGKAMNRTFSTPIPHRGPILGGESDLVAARIREVVGEEPQRAFARRCGISEGSLRDYMREESPKMPGLSAAVAIAHAGGVLVDWLASGRPPKTLVELKALQDGVQAAVASTVDSMLLQQVIDFYGRWLRDNADRVRIDDDRHGAVIAVLYRIAAASGRVDSGEMAQVMQLAA